MPDMMLALAAALCNLHDVLKVCECKSPLALTRKSGSLTGAAGLHATVDEKSTLQKLAADMVLHAGRSITLWLQKSLGSVSMLQPPLWSPAVSALAHCKSLCTACTANILLSALMLCPNLVQTQTHLAFCNTQSTVCAYTTLLNKYC